MYDGYEDLGTVTLATSSSSTSTSPSIRILQITDLHLFPRECDSFQGIPLHDAHAHCLQLIGTLVQDTSPDVIVLTGDIIDGRGPWHDADRVVESMEQLVPHFQGIPWLYIPGNHDDDHSPWKRHDLMRILQLPGCLQRDAQGFHHTILLTKPISSTGSNNSHVKAKVKVRLHLFDSGGNHPNPKVMYYCTPPLAIQGFTQWTHQYTESETDVTGLVYIHIPTPEYQGLDPVRGHNRLFEAALAGGKIPSPLDKLAWLIKLLKLHRIAGCTRGKDSGLFQALVQANHPHRHNNNNAIATASANIVAVFCGHDHHSDAVFWRQGIFLAYGRSAAMTPPYDWEGKAPNPFPRGARVVEVSSDGTVKTWIQNAAGLEQDSFLDMTNYDDPRQSSSCC